MGECGEERPGGNDYRFRVDLARSMGVYSIGACFIWRRLRTTSAKTETMSLCLYSSRRDSRSRRAVGAEEVDRTVLK